MGIFGRKIRGGSGSNHMSGRMDYPYAGDGSPAPKAPAQPEAPAGPPPSTRYNIKGGGGDYLHITPNEGGTHNVSRYGSKGELKYSTKNAWFDHDKKSNTVGWYAGRDHGGQGGKGQLEIWGDPS